MSYENLLQQEINLKKKAVNGLKYGLYDEGLLIQIAETNCDYCKTKILAIWDHLCPGPFFYQGNQAKRINSYLHSEIIQIMKRLDGCESKVWQNALANSHTRVHCMPENWEKRGHRNALKILCNSCFQMTYNRIKIQGNDGMLYAVSVVNSRGETVESVMKELNIKGAILEKGSINNY